jgi:Asp-tRNA(Asn)/Glu-tRNA(Gln) amidotransferase A subunit family amidase
MNREEQSRFPGFLGATLRDASGEVRACQGVYRRKARQRGVPDGHTIDTVNGDHLIGLVSHSAALAGYPLVSTPAGYVQGLPVGITFMGALGASPR